MRRWRETEIPFGEEGGFNVGEGAVVGGGWVEEGVEGVIEDEGDVGLLDSVYCVFCMERECVGRVCIECNMNNDE